MNILFIFRLQWGAIITSCSIVLFLWSVIIRYYCLTSSNDDDCKRLSFAWWPFAYCSTNGITLYNLMFNSINMKFIYVDVYSFFKNPMFIYMYVYVIQ